jgi:Flp pilus assembly protein TadD
MLKRLLNVTGACLGVEFGHAKGLSMHRNFVRTAAVVFCAAWATGCASDTVQKPTAPTTAQNQPAAADLPTTLDGEVARAHKLRLDGRYDESGKALAQILLVAPDDPRVVGEYGKVLAQEGRPGDALPFLVRAIQMQPNDWTLYSAEGVAYDQADQHLKARGAYEHALALKPGQPDVLNNYAVSRMLVGDIAGAHRLLDQAKGQGGDAKIGHNLALLETMKPPAPKPVAPKPATPAAAAPAGAPGAAAAAPGAATPSNTAAATPAKPATVAQKLPADPNAATGAPRKLGDAAAKPELRHQDGQPAAANQPPVLRTAADSQ